MKQLTAFATLCAAVLFAWAGAAPAWSQTNGPGQKIKQFAVEQVVNEQATYKIKVFADRPDGTYYEGEALSLEILATRDCYVYVLDIRPDGEINCLFPNERQKDNFVKGGVKVHVPAQDAGYRLVTRAPFGEETIQVLATLNPIELFPGKSLTKAKVTPLRFRDYKAAVDRMKGFEVEPVTDEPTPTPNPGPGPNGDIWAEGKFTLKTFAGKRP